MCPACKKPDWQTVDLLQNAIIHSIGKENQNKAPRIHGVCFAIRNSLVPCIAMFPIGNEKLAHMKFASPQGKVNVICAYSPTFAAPEEEKDRFFQALEDVNKSISKFEHRY
ncbi:craniofacial development protein 2 [Biomphalaria glabrata]|nr:craniofacial development protein 2 [Biomphalaria glabrata]